MLIACQWWTGILNLGMLQAEISKSEKLVPHEMGKKSHGKNRNRNQIEKDNSSFLRCSGPIW